MKKVRWIVGLLAATGASACGARSFSQDNTVQVDTLAGDKVLGSGAMRVAASRTPSHFESETQVDSHLQRAIPILSDRFSHVFLTFEKESLIGSEILGGQAVFAVAGYEGCGEHKAPFGCAG